MTSRPPPPSPPRSQLQVHIGRARLSLDFWRGSVAGGTATRTSADDGANVNAGNYGSGASGLERLFADEAAYLAAIAGLEAAIGGPLAADWREAEQRMSTTGAHSSRWSFAFLCRALQRVVRQLFLAVLRLIARGAITCGAPEACIWLT